MADYGGTFFFKVLRRYNTQGFSDSPSYGWLTGKHYAAQKQKPREV